MRVIFFLVLWTGNWLCFSQEITTEFVTKIPLDADTFIGVDDLGNIYYLQNNTLHKKEVSKVYSYTNTLLGKITSVDIKNPLKILVFYRDFNTILFLDNRLNELTNPINFLEESIAKNMNAISLSSNNNLWMYSSDDNTLALWNHQSKKTIFTSQPLQFYKENFKPTSIVSSYKEVCIFNNETALFFNEFGAYINNISLNKTDQLHYNNNQLFGVEENTIYQYQNGLSKKVRLSDKDISIKSFYVNKDHLYIFDGSSIFVFKFLKI